MMDENTLAAFGRIISERVIALTKAKLNEFNKTKVLCNGDKLVITAKVELDQHLIHCIHLALDVELPKAPPQWVDR